MAGLTGGAATQYPSDVIPLGLTAKGEGTNSKAGTSKEGNEVKIKEFFWDQFVKYLASIMAVITVLDVSLEFLRGSGPVCNVAGTIEGRENVTIEITRDQATYINNVCQGDLSRAEHYPFFVLIQGIVLAAPHFIWTSLFAGDFDFFFSLVNQIDRFCSRNTGKYHTKNFDIAKQLEEQFSQKIIFISYFAKLVIQLIFVITSVMINEIVFHYDYFDFNFECFLNTDHPPLLPMEISCVFLSFRLYGKLKYFNLSLLILAFILLCYGIIWCVCRHPVVLGSKNIALFAYNSCLRPTDYVGERFYRSPFNPRIRNDIDFLLLKLYRADSGYGIVFKDIQVESELDKVSNKGRESLRLSLDAQDQISDQKIKEELMPIIRKSISAIFNKFATDRRTAKFSTDRRTAVSISFGSNGNSLILAGGFKDILSLNIDPFYASERPLFLEFRNIRTVTLQEDIFSKESTFQISETPGQLNEYWGNLISKMKMDVIIVGPISDNRKLTTANVFLDGIISKQRCWDQCLLIYFRPVKIGPKSVNFCPFIPPSSFQNSKVSERLNGIISNQTTTPESLEYDEEKGIYSVSTKCHETDCQFEITVYEYKIPHGAP